MTEPSNEQCPAQALLKILSGKLKPEIFRMARYAPVRFNQLMRSLDDANKQSLANALNDLVAHELLVKVTIQQKPLHIEYRLTKKGKELIPVFEQLEEVGK